jgi:uncharacterized membrane protein
MATLTPCMAVGASALFLMSSDAVMDKVLDAFGE